MFGDVFVRDPLKNLVKVASVSDFESDECQGNPVTAYLQRHGTAQNALAWLPEAYTLTGTKVCSTFKAPLTNEPFSKVSGDFNPIHVDLTSLTMPRCLARSRTASGRVLLLAAMLRMSSRRASLSVLSRDDSPLCFSTCSIRVEYSMPLSGPTYSKGRLAGGESRRCRRGN